MVKFPGVGPVFLQIGPPRLWLLPRARVLLVRDRRWRTSLGTQTLPLAWVHRVSPRCEATDRRVSPGVYRRVSADQRRIVRVSYNAYRRGPLRRRGQPADDLFPLVPSPFTDAKHRRRASALSAPVKTGAYTDPRRSAHPPTSRSKEATRPSPSQDTALPSHPLTTAGLRQNPTRPHCTTTNSSTMHVAKRLSTPACLSILPCRSVRHIASTLRSRIAATRHLNLALWRSSPLAQLAPCMFQVARFKSEYALISLVRLSRYPLRSLPLFLPPLPVLRSSMPPTCPPTFLPDSSSRGVRV